MLDEPTAALDVRVEAEIFERFLESTRGMTTILVSHRLSSVRHVDTLAFLQHGRLEAVGSFDEVARQSPSFARLVALGRLEGEDLVR